MTSNADADGKTVWSWHPLLVSSCRRQIDPTGDDSHQAGSDGDKTNPSPGRARKKPLKPLRRECRSVPVYLYARVLIYMICNETAGASRARHSLRPRYGGKRFKQTSGEMCRENAKSTSRFRHCERSEAIHSFFVPGECWIASLRSQ